MSREVQRTPVNKPADASGGCNGVGLEKPQGYGTP